MLEIKYYEQGYRYIIGLDEAGRGPMAGPLVAGAVCLPVHDPDLEDKIKGVKDSKQMTPRQRERAAEKIQEVALTWGIGLVNAREMADVGNMTQVTLEAMRRAVEDAQKRGAIQGDFLLIDYYKFPFFPETQQEAITKGDTLSLSIAAASVLAKVYRDNLMIEYAHTYPQYGFEKHKGYPTAAHQEALFKHGPCDIHRRNYAPVQKSLEAFLE
jgi:ribonuclease HII